MDKEQLLYDYFSNRLTPEQERLFAQLLETDGEFKQQFDFENNLKRVIREKEAKQLKAKLIGFEEGIQKEETARAPFTVYRKWAMAASIALLVGLGWLGYNNFSGSGYMDMYEEHFQEYPNTVYAITRGEEADTSLERQAFVAYETNDNVQAIALFTQLKETKNTEAVNFYLAQSYLKNGQAEKAIALFDETINEKGEFRPQALWYAALAYLKINEKENAIRMLNDLVADGRYKKEEASKLLKDLE
ncbi:tetratricopeptide repeat protein [Zobellia galactanivorans]|uniref:tetratricopeptide repeat protein n=1 Tax=Zobellia galactanivorans (strain DSM 12802 / CCUG 47099 / CIP 106680 / NCIMB 13871 / Dsij) TaxID=63186 RepID=UPI0026E2FAE1|nr:tetratricopeptide repeat protein [Zobellia galactanivorans]MDO6810869.1 tetratricopeptide repeat protein [Zobellia galactanivorans]